MKIIQEYKSRKNNVMLVEDEDRLFIRKIYKDINTFNYALFMFENLGEKLKVPRVVSAYNNTIDMQYVDGYTLLELYLEADEVKANILADKLYDYIFALNNAGYVQKDCNFSNFIINEREIIGIDYDEMSPPSEEYGFLDSLADIIIFAITYSGISADVKIAFAKRIVELAEELTDIFINRAVSRLIIRRGSDKDLDYSLLTMCRQTKA